MARGRAPKPIPTDKLLSHVTIRRVVYFYPEKSAFVGSEVLGGTPKVAPVGLRVNVVAGSQTGPADIKLLVNTTRSFAPGTWWAWVTPGDFEEGNEQLRKVVKDKRILSRLGNPRGKRRRKKNPVACALYARRGRGPLMWYDGRKFTNNGRPKYFGTRARAVALAHHLRRKFTALASYALYVGPPQRRTNPESRQVELDRAADLLEDFSGHPAKKVIKVRQRMPRAGLIVGELDQIGYQTKREGINAGKLTRYTHEFGSSSRPLLAVSPDGKQLVIVGGRYHFTDAGIEDR